MTHETRRSFLGKLAAASAATAAPGVLTASDGPSARVLRAPRRRSPNDQIQIALIGAGGMGTVDTNTALEIDGVKLVAICDLYDGRLEKAQEEWGGGEDGEERVELVKTRDYREILARDDIDAVIVATPDHWHRRISIEGLRAGKAVYCEKPMVHRIDEGMDVVLAQRETGGTLQVGSQGMSSLGNEKARQLYREGAIGELNYAEGFWARNSPGGAWQYEVPDDASEETVDWGAFLGDRPRLPFDPLRFFRWRNYRDYGTGVSGDLFVHLFSSLHYIVGSAGPTKIQSTGGLRFWQDGREVPDVLLGMFDYPQTADHPAFNLSLRVNFVDGTSGNTVLRLVGSDGAMDVTWTEVTLRRNKRNDPLAVFEPEEENTRAARFGERKEMLPPAEAVYKAENGYWGAHRDHFINFFDGMRGGAPVVQDAVFGLRAAAPALACNDAYFDDRIVRWDPVAMRVIE